MNGPDEDYCERCGGNITWKPIKQTGKRKPALRGKFTCDGCGFWPLAHVTHGTPSLKKPEAKKGK